MTKIAMVEGCNIFIYRERGGQHHAKHFHVTGPGWSVTVPLDAPEKYQGDLPRNKRKAIMNFAKDKRAAILKAIEDLDNALDVDWIGG